MICNEKQEPIQRDVNTGNRIGKDIKTVMLHIFKNIFDIKNDFILNEA